MLRFSKGFLRFGGAPRGVSTLGGAVGAFGGMVPVFFPAERILHDVAPESQEGFFVLDDLVEKSRLPGEFSVSGIPDPAAASTFEMADGLPQRPWAPIEVRTVDVENAVKMIRHDDPGIERHVGT